MDRLIYSSMTGAKAMLDRQDAIAHNLANANTDGFRAEMALFRSVPVRQDGTATTRVFALDATAHFNTEQGPVRHTDNPLDIAVRGEGWIAVQAPDGTEAYTRGGSLTVDAEGVLRTHAGHAVQGDGGPLTLPMNAEPFIGTDGTVSARVGNQPIQLLGRIKLVNPPAQDLVKGADGLIRLRGGGEADQDPQVRVADGVVEGSNVNVVEAMVGMIAVQRQFEMQMKMIQTAQGDDERAQRLLSVQG